MKIDTDLLITGAGPFGLSVAAYAAHRGLNYRCVGAPMEFWRASMPKGMYLRSACDWHLDPIGIDTIEANHALGLKADYSDFSLPAAIMHELGISKVRLLSNNPHKLRARSDAGIEVVSRVHAKLRQTRMPSLTCERRRKE